MDRDHGLRRVTKDIGETTTAQRIQLFRCGLVIQVHARRGISKAFRRLFLQAFQGFGCGAAQGAARVNHEHVLEVGAGPALLSEGREG